MKITKFVHSCLMVELPDRTALFDPGFMAEGVLDVDMLEYLDDIIITHEHGDHFSPGLIRRLVQKFPEVRITAPPSVAEQLRNEGIRVGNEEAEDIEVFTAPHESVEPLLTTPESRGYHYLGLLTHPGDSHSFDETKEILALPITAPWGTVMNALKLAIRLKPSYVIPIHDWHWRDEARIGIYDRAATVLEKEGIHFIKPVNGEAFNVET